MNDQVESDGHAPRWFAGDRRLYSIDGFVDRDGEDNPERLAPGTEVRLPRTIRATFGFSAAERFVLAAVRRLPQGSMGFCEIKAQPGRGLWVQLRHLTRTEWHTGTPGACHRHNGRA